MSAPLSWQNLDALVTRGCQAPGCTHQNHGPLYLHSKCHPESGVWGRYEAGSGVLVLLCRRCREEVACVLVGERREAREDDGQPE